MESFLELIKPEPDRMPDDTIHEFMAWQGWSPDYKPNKAVLNSLIASGKIALVENQTLNYKLNVWPTELEKHDDWIDTIESNANTFGPFLIEYYQLRNSSKITSGGEKAGPSRFPFDQRALLSLPVLESAVESKRITTDALLQRIGVLQTLQQEILDLIDAELAERGMGGDCITDPSRLEAPIN